MKPFELFQPTSLADVAKRAGPGSVLKAAGIDLLDRLKERIEEPATVVDLTRFKSPEHGELAAIRRDGGAAHIGALATLQQIADAAALDDPAWAALRTTCGLAATPQIRNRATLGGNLLQMARCWYLRSAAFGCLHGGKGPECLAYHGQNRYHAILGHIDCVRVHPSNTAPALLALDAVVHVQSGDAERTLPIRQLYPDEPYAEEAEHTLKPGEVLTRVDLPAPVPGARSAYRESREKLSFDWPTTAAAVWVVLQDGVIADARICLGAVAPNPFPVPEAAALLRGAKPSDELFAKVAAKAFEGAEPLEHNAYKVEVGRAVLIDALAEACGRTR